MSPPPPYLQGAPFAASGARQPLFDVDFTTLSLGARSQATFATETAVNNPGGLVFERASVGTVQTSATTIDSTPTVNQPGIGCLDSTQSKRGLVMQPRTALCLLNIIFPRTIIGWNPGEGSLNPAWNGWAGQDSEQSNNDAVSPDGLTKAIRLKTYIGMRGSPAYSPPQLDGSYSIYGASAGVTAPATFSMWCKGTLQMVTTVGGNPSPPTTVPLGGASALRVASTGVWTRAAMTGIGIGPYAIVADGRDYSSCAGAPYIPSGGLTPIECHADFINVTRGIYIPEAIELTGGVCAAHFLHYPTGSDIVAANHQLKMSVILSPKHASTSEVYHGVNDPDITLGFSIWSYEDAGVKSYVRIRQSDRKLAVKVGVMTEIVSTNAIVFGQNSKVQIHVAVGGNVASVARYRIHNGTTWGAWVDLVLATVANNVAPGANPIYFLSSPFNAITFGGSSDDYFGWCCRVHRLTTYDEFDQAVAA
jgi:hypothetical protein